MGCRGGWWKKPLKDSDKCVMPPVIPPHLGKGVCLCMCVRVADGAESIRTVCEQKHGPGPVNQGSMLVFLCMIARMHL